MSEIFIIEFLLVALVFGSVVAGVFVIGLKLFTWEFGKPLMLQLKEVFEDE